MVKVNTNVHATPAYADYQLSLNLDTIQTYTEQWQYLPWVGTHKRHPDEDSLPKHKLVYDEQDLPTKEIWNRSCHRNEFAVGVKQFTFRELVDATRAGHTLKRIGPDTNGSRYLIIDLDNDANENITTSELDSFCSSPNMAWTKGGSGRDYRYHLFVFLDKKISYRMDFESKANTIKQRLEEHIGRPIKLDTHQCNYLQVCYGVPQHLMERRILPGTMGWYRQIRKNSSFRFETVDPLATEEKTVDEPRPKNKTESLTTSHPKLVPWNSSLLLNLLKDGSLQAKKYTDGSYVNGPDILQGTRFDCIEPRAYGKFVPVGKRHLTAQAWIYRLVPSYYRCINQGLNFTKDDLVHTFHHLCQKNFQDFDSWWKADGRNLSSSLVQECDKWSGLPYEEIEASYTPSHKKDIYKRQGYAFAATCDICREYGRCPDGTHIQFSSRSDLEHLLTDKALPYSTFQHYIKLLGYTTCYQHDARQTHRYDYILDSATIIGGAYYYTQKRNAIKCFCDDHGIRYLSMSRLVSTPRQKYKAIIAEATDAVKYMIEATNGWTEESIPTVHANSVEEAADPDDIPVLFVDTEFMGSQISSQETPSPHSSSLIISLEIEDPISTESKND